MKQLHVTFYLYVVLLFAACAQLSLTPPQTLEDRVMTSYATVGAAYTTISELAKRRAITREQGQRMIGKADYAKMLIDNADSLLTAGNGTQAEQSLQFAITILTALEAELKSKGTQ